MPETDHTTQSGFLQTSDCFKAASDYAKQRQILKNVHITVTNTASNTIINNLVQRKRIFNALQLLTALGKTSDLVLTEKNLLQTKTFLANENEPVIIWCASNSTSDVILSWFG